MLELDRPAVLKVRPGSCRKNRDGKSEPECALPEASSNRGIYARQHCQMVNKWLHLNFGICQAGVKNAMNSQITLAIERPTILNRYASFYLATQHAKWLAVAANAGDCCRLPHRLASSMQISKK
jgi:hypothetical protein